MTSATLPADVLNALRTQTGESLDELSRKSPVLVVFLRHCACTFAREALDDVARQRAAITASGTTIVLVHMQTDAEAQALFTRYKLGDLPRISDPEQKLYQAFDLQRGSVWQVMGPANVLPAIASIFRGNGSAIPNSDIFQLPGAFLMRDGQVVNAFRATRSSERPDYAVLAGCKI
ncbi:MAG: AhpC/TSA family protein [Planctomycetaceae bacterium]|nr:AhpC/TSA family protein [Planctomycetaceae bacterium]